MPAYTGQAVHARSNASMVPNQHGTIDMLIVYDMGDKACPHTSKKTLKTYLEHLKTVRTEQHNRVQNG